MSVENGSYFYNLEAVRSDPRLAYFLLKEARSRALERVFGVSREQQFLLTLILLGMAGRGIRAKAVRIRRLVPRLSANEGLIGSSLLDEAVHMLAGDSTPDAPLVGSMVALALLAALVRPGVHDIRGAARTARAELARIPQYIVRLNRPDEASSAS